MVWGSVLESDEIELLSSSILEDGSIISAVLKVSASTLFGQGSLSEGNAS